MMTDTPAQNEPLERCTFERINPVEVKCQRCGLVVLTRTPPGNVRAICRSQADWLSRVIASDQIRAAEAEALAVHLESTKVAILDEAAEEMDAGKIARRARAGGAKVAGRARAGGEQSLLALVHTFGKAIIEQTAAGWPMRDEAEIVEILETHCKPCELFDGAHCSACGCRVNAGKFANKLAWATQHCPEKRW